MGTRERLDKIAERYMRMKPKQNKPPAAVQAIPKCNRCKFAKWVSGACKCSKKLLCSCEEWCIIHNRTVPAKIRPLACNTCKFFEELNVNEDSNPE